ncbi:ABC transporter substrate-binding protein [Halovulum dunhuangense]|uniref:ABC transporter substrate-binding protein n=1 Tax=Halovulum dunhuangense TaxID=1505036 RepID=A0A849L7I4_9RHOB|nr:ABC transporter substrate-binding protein [Halovulum dunhuangense]NNU82082.1 ABC transporter substrate-binding protein [Halovulum dunhuangense]
MIAAIACGSTASAAPLRILGAMHCADAPTTVAWETGLLQATGLDIRLSRNATGRENLEALREGRAEFALMPMTPFVIDLLSDTTPGGAEDPVILANIAHATDIEALVTLRPRHDRPGAFPEGGKIGFPGGTMAEFIWSLWSEGLRASGAGPTPENVAPPDIGDALEAGRIDAAIVWEPWLEGLRHRFGDRLVILDPPTRGHATRWLLVTRRDIAQTRAKDAAAVLDAYRAAVRLMDSDRPAAEAAMSRWMPFSDSHIEKLRNNTIYDVTLDWATYSDFREQVRWAMSAGHAGAGAVPDFLSVVAAAPLLSVSPHEVFFPVAAPAFDAAPILP